MPVAAAMSAVVWTVYLLACGDGTLYCGTTNDVARRLAMHQKGTGARYTRGRGPLRLVWTEPHATRGDALRRELAVKRMTRAAKLRLAATAPAA